VKKEESYVNTQTNSLYRAEINTKNAQEPIWGQFGSTQLHLQQRSTLQSTISVRHIRNTQNLFENMQNIEMQNMRQKYAEMGCDRIFAYFWHHTFRPQRQKLDKHLY